MDTQIVINWPKYDNLPTEPGWYLLERTNGYMEFVEVDLYIDRGLIVLETGECADVYTDLFEYAHYKWSDKIEL